MVLPYKLIAAVMTDVHGTDLSRSQHDYGSRGLLIKMRIVHPVKPSTSELVVDHSYVRWKGELFHLTSGKDNDMMY
jgi:hypothetical protein